MLIRKPEGMCTVSNDVQKRTVTTGFHTAEQAKVFRDSLLDTVILSAQGSVVPRKEPTLDFGVQSVVASSVIETLKKMRDVSAFMTKYGSVELGAIFRTHVDQIENDIDTYLNSLKG